MMLRGRSTLPAHREEDLLRHSSAEDVVVAANGLVPELRDVVRRERGPSIGAERPLGEDNSGSSGALYRSIVPALSESGEEFVTPVTLIVPELRPQAIAEDEVDDVPVVSLALEPRFIPRQHTSVEQAKERATLSLPPHSQLRRGRFCPAAVACPNRIRRRSRKRRRSSRASSPSWSLHEQIMHSRWRRIRGGKRPSSPNGTSWKSASGLSDRSWRRIRGS
ncbi:hypothetical protein DFJ74DRAFT_668747 [Hyaloraphidium curvatum]|nr:hypothetical protein DFJ74DRAFT_668747 [Hyaloraphidium curvatum]